MNDEKLKRDIIHPFIPIQYVQFKQFLRDNNVKCNDFKIVVCLYIYLNPNSNDSASSDDCNFSFQNLDDYESTCTFNDILKYSFSIRMVGNYLNVKKILRKFKTHSEILEIHFSSYRLLETK